MTPAASTLAPSSAARFEDEIERLIALLDAADGGPDLEPDDFDPPGLIWGGGEDGGPALHL